MQQIWKAKKGKHRSIRQLGSGAVTGHNLARQDINRLESKALALLMNEYGEQATKKPLKSWASRRWQMGHSFPGVRCSMVGLYLDVTTDGTVKDRQNIRKYRTTAIPLINCTFDALAILSNVLKVTRADWVSPFTPSHPLTGVTIVRLGR